MRQHIDSGEHIVHKIQVLTILYAVCFSLYSIGIGQYDFLFLNSYLYLFAILIPFYYRRIHMPVQLITAFSVFCFFQVLGSVVIIDHVPLAEFTLFPGTLMVTYSSFIHVIGGFVSALVAYTLYRSHLDAYVTHHVIPMTIFLITYALGVSSYNELSKLASHIVFDTPFGDAAIHATNMFWIVLGAMGGVAFIYCHYVLGLLTHDEG
jgi:hypothetical protein